MLVLVFAVIAEAQQTGKIFRIGFLDKEQMGHSSINVTVDIYGHLVPGGNRQAVDKLDDAMPITAKKTA